MGLDDLTDEEIVALPFDRLSLLLLQHPQISQEWNTDNFINSPTFKKRDPGAQRALVETIGWLEANLLIAHPRAVPPGVVGIERSVVMLSDWVGGVGQDASKTVFARSTSLVSSSSRAGSSRAIEPSDR